MKDSASTPTAVCPVCFRHCQLQEGQKGFCSARSCRNGKIVCDAYGKVTSLALDPIEKKPLRRFHPGSLVVSVGSYGCSLACPFCQNYEISRKTESSGTRYISPEELLEITLRTKEKYPATIGVAYTYNEPLTSWEYVRDAAKLIHEAGLMNVLVTSGNAETCILDELLPYIDAMNIDLKGFDEAYFRDFLHGNMQETLDFITHAVTYRRERPDNPSEETGQQGPSACHVELTTLIIPGKNDSDHEMEEETAWIASLTPEACGTTEQKGTIPLHISRYFPRYHLNLPATPVSTIYHLAEVARQHLQYVYTGNC